MKKHKRKLFKTRMNEFLPMLVINLVGQWLNLDRNENEVSNVFISTRQAAIFDRVDVDNRKLH